MIIKAIFHPHSPPSPPHSPLSPPPPPSPLLSSPLPLPSPSPLSPPPSPLPPSPLPPSPLPLPQAIQRKGCLLINLVCGEEYLGSCHRTQCTAIAKVVIDALSRWRTEPEVQIEVWHSGALVCWLLLKLFSKYLRFEGFIQDWGTCL